MAYQNADIWSLGCILSEVAVWIHGGTDSISSYRAQRQKERSKKPGLSDIESFHNGTDVLDAVKMHHQQILDKLPYRLITRPILRKLVQSMLEKEEGRPNATQLSFQKGGIIAQATSRMNESYREDDYSALNELEGFPSKETRSSFGEPDKLVEPRLRTPNIQVHDSDEYRESPNSLRYNNASKLQASNQEPIQRQHEVSRASQTGKTIQSCVQPSGKQRLDVLGSQFPINDLEQPGNSGAKLDNPSATSSRGEHASTPIGGPTRASTGLWPLRQQLKEVDRHRAHSLSHLGDQSRLTPPLKRWTVDEILEFKHDQQRHKLQGPITREHRKILKSRNHVRGFLSIYLI